MVSISRRGLIRTSLTAVSGALAMPYIARAEAKTAVCWLNQGFVPQEDEAMKKELEVWGKNISAGVKDVVGKTRVLLEGRAIECRLKECNLGNVITNGMVHMVNPSPT